MPAQLPALRIQKARALEQLKSRVEEGKRLDDEIGAGSIANNSNFEEYCRKADAWRAYNELLLRRLFTTEEFAQDYQASIGAIHLAEDRYMDPTLGTLVRRLRSSLASQLSRINSIVSRIDLLDEDQAITPNSADTTNVEYEKTAFIVHGHDKAVLFEMVAFLGKAGVRPIILNEAPGGALTIIEKLVRHSNVGFVVVLLTPDDVGGKNISGERSLAPRARQNVIGELFFFAGKFGRERMIVFKKGEIEFPTDILGIGWHEFDEHGGWKTHLLRELAEAGFEIDQKAVLG
ncbi:TIR domain-containing protein [Rhizomicrobium electricum]|uniref:CD-NTase-associated protein 12/Pycsar effector protein TIR domain-containing protein n=1 Tax=Rhizomicrobium electricum TaxID=480070 RepID=A0ABN1E4D1_9PROT|nr:nucleotide-binding protein [Rhizomicrobium electricum]NIJ47619.1 putative nucleotide-binding protein [Rhizomicrobium electricum]